MKKKYKKKKIKYFTKRVLFWQRMLGFTDMEIYIGETARKTCRACWEDDSPGKIMAIRYNLKWIKEPATDKDELDLVAFHEVYESQFYMIEALLNPYYSGKMIAAEAHLLVRRAEAHIFPRLRKFKL